MKPSKLGQVLTAFETTNGSVSLPQLAQELEVSPEQLEGMLQHWVRKGKIRESKGLTDCGRCQSKGSCAFVVAMPRSYELVAADVFHCGGSLARPDEERRPISWW